MVRKNSNLLKNLFQSLRTLVQPRPYALQHTLHGFSTAQTKGLDKNHSVSLDRRIPKRTTHPKRNFLQAKGSVLEFSISAVQSHHQIEIKMLPDKIRLTAACNCKPRSEQQKIRGSLHSVDDGAAPGKHRKFSLPGQIRASRLALQLPDPIPQLLVDVHSFQGPVSDLDLEMSLQSFHQFRLRQASGSERNRALHRSGETALTNESSEQGFGLHA